eukprot:1936812-Amphidinium_carterae.1
MAGETRIKPVTADQQKQILLLYCHDITEASEVSLSQSSRCRSISGRSLANAAIVMRDLLLQLYLPNATRPAQSFS